jgi:hypothetical protein
MKSRSIAVASLLSLCLAFLRGSAGDGDDPGLHLPFNFRMIKSDHQLPIPTAVPTTVPTTVPTSSELVSLTDIPSAAPTAHWFGLDTIPPAPPRAGFDHVPTKSSASWFTRHNPKGQRMYAKHKFSNWHIAYKEALRRAALQPGSSESGTTNCTNGEKDWDESDLDCGGVCPGCASGRHCFVNEDCTSGQCLQGSKCSLTTIAPTTASTTAPTSTPAPHTLGTNPLFPTLQPTYPPTLRPSALPTEINALFKEPAKERHDSQTWLRGSPTHVPTAAPSELLLSRLGALSGGDDDDLSHHSEYQDDDGKRAAAALLDHTAAPTLHPTVPTTHPTLPTTEPTSSPTFLPTSGEPTSAPTFAPTYVPIVHPKLVRKWVSKAYPGQCNTTCDIQPLWSDIQNDWILSNTVCRYPDHKDGLRHACIRDSKRLLYNGGSELLGVKQLRYGYHDTRQMVWLENTELNVLVDLIKTIKTGAPTVSPTARPISLAEITQSPAVRSCVLVCSITSPQIVD